MALKTATSNQAIAEPMMEMNMTPLIDVMLVLIIMLIITIPKQNHAIGLVLPQHGSVSEKPQIVTIDIDFDGTVLWDGVIVASRGELERKLRAVAASAEAASVQLRPNRLADYKFVAGVMAAAQRSQIKNLGVTGHEMFL